MLQEKNELLQIRLDEFISMSTTTDSQQSFLSDTVTLCSEELAEPFVLELDLNRREDGEGIFRQYSFLNGHYAGASFSDYELLYKAGSTPQPNSFINNFSRLPASDLLTRDSYEVDILVYGQPLKFSLENIEGDFITRYQPEDTQHQSIATTIISYRGQQFEAHVLVESRYSNDSDKYLFADDRDTLEATTRQFILWDETGNFYMSDLSEVMSDTVSYPAHNWLVYKNTITGSLKKASNQLY